MKKYFVHKTAEIEKKVKIGVNTKIWHLTQIRQNSIIGENCVFGKNVFIDFETIVGNNCKIQNNCSIYHKTVLEDGVFLGPNVVILNDKNPRAINSIGDIKTPKDWEAGTVVICLGASVGAGSIILPNIRIGKYALVGAGSIVTKDIPDYALVYGNPARVYGSVDESGKITKRF